ncbi:DUF2927 domain-containing protein [Pseudooceanicola aestuarii]|uniref:DUF2927 domain-containing protein n=1 Tax=Pseudooceanicola aestuarii TaxID=2697319 RepID=UPI001952C425|nr:DUF2927 domain-containing protein [Pseudooceanicola aestuarii]
MADDATGGLRGGTLRGLLGVAALALVGACQSFPSAPPQVTPRVRPAALAPADPAPAPPAPSAASEELRGYYERVQSNLLAQGLLRRDGGGIDTPFNATDLARNFERLAFFHEYERGTGLSQARETPDFMRRWSGPLRLQVEFGASVPPDQQRSDSAEIDSYANRLAQVTGHPIQTVTRGGNFHILVMGEDDREDAVRRIRQLVPNAADSAVSIIRTLPRPIHCLVFGFSAEQNDNVYRRAIAFVRAEHPGLMRQSCFHEEIAQGLGLANDSPRARPSIFNDDDEFALLTNHDELLLKMLYDPRLRPGMTLEQARPTIGIISRELMGSSS